MEIERKYLVKSLPNDIDRYEHTEIEQGYLCTSPTLRIRKMGDAYILTVKEKVVSESAAIVNREEEFALTQEKYEALRLKCDGQLVKKTRYRIPISGGLIAELDVFHGQHEGLILVEVEFPTVNEANSFVPPSWFGQDVSADKRYRNSWLAFNEA